MLGGRRCRSRVKLKPHIGNAPSASFEGGTHGKERVLGGPPALSARKAGHEPYLCRMFKAFDFCIPTKSTIVPVGPDWLHEVKYDGVPASAGA
jgi:hypothetical protein